MEEIKTKIRERIEELRNKYIKWKYSVSLIHPNRESEMQKLHFAISELQNILKLIKMKEEKKPRTPIEWIEFHIDHLKQQSKEMCEYVRLHPNPGVIIEYGERIKDVESKISALQLSLNTIIQSDNH